MSNCLKETKLRGLVLLSQHILLSVQHMYLLTRIAEQSNKKVLDVSMLFYGLVQWFLNGVKALEKPRATGFECSRDVE